MKNPRVGRCLHHQSHQIQIDSKHFSKRRNQINDFLLCPTSGCRLPERPTICKAEKISIRPPLSATEISRAALRTAPSSSTASFTHPKLETPNDQTSRIGLFRCNHYPHSVLLLPFPSEIILPLPLPVGLHLRQCLRGPPPLHPHPPPPRGGDARQRGSRVLRPIHPHVLQRPSPHRLLRRPPHLPDLPLPDAHPPTP